MNQETDEPGTGASGLSAESSSSKKVKYDLTGDDDTSTPIRPDESPGMGWLWAPVGLILLGALFFLRNSFSGGSARVHLADCGKNLKTMAAAMDAYAAEHNGAFPKTLDELVSSGKLQALPTCPSAGSVTYKLLQDAKKHSFTIFCGGLYHRDVLDKKAPDREAEDLPNYNSLSGDVTSL